ncbi:MAG: hypothetical protein ACXWPS_20665, partial [Ktedonobacteraceae bacterium]
MKKTYRCRLYPMVKQEITLNARLAFCWSCMTPCCKKRRKIYLEMQSNQQLLAAEHPLPRSIYCMGFGTSVGSMRDPGSLRLATVGSIYILSCQEPLLFMSMGLGNGYPDASPDYRAECSAKQQRKRLQERFRATVRRFGAYSIALKEQ